MRKAEGIGEETQNLCEAREKELQEELTPPSQPYNLGALLAQRFEENRKKQKKDNASLEAQAEEQVAWLISHGAKRPKAQVSGEDTPITPIEIEIISIDPRIIRNRFVSGCIS